MNIIDILRDRYQRWNEENGLSLGSADEHLTDPKLTVKQRAWLQNFSSEWTAAESLEAAGARDFEDCLFDGVKGTWFGIVVNDTVVTDPHSSECGRFVVDPVETYGLTSTESWLIYRINLERLAKLRLGNQAA